MRDKFTLEFGWLASEQPLERNQTILTHRRRPPREEQHQRPKISMEKGRAARKHRRAAARAKPRLDLAPGGTSPPLETCCCRRRRTTSTLQQNSHPIFV